MARVRSSPRDASRHTGRQYQTGRQFEFDGIRTLQLGPWEEIVDNPFSGLHQNTVTECFPYRIYNGKLSPFLVNSQISTIAYDDNVVGAGSAVVLGEPYRLVWATDAGTGRLNLDVYDSGGTLTQVDTNETSNGGRVIWAMWGKTIFFIQQGAAGGTNTYLFQYEIDSGVTSLATIGYAIATSGKKQLTNTPANLEPWFLFFLDNNLCILTQSDTATPTLYWFADSDPYVMPGALSAATGLTPSGAGNFMVKSDFGDVTGFGHFDNSTFLNCNYGAYRISPTGTLPAFRFEEQPYMTGCPVVNGTVGGSSGVGYIGRDGFFRITQGGVPQSPGGQPPRWNAFSPTIYLAYAPGIDAWVVWDTSEGDLDSFGMILDGASMKWSGKMPMASYGLLSNTSYDAGLFGGTGGADILELYSLGGTFIKRYDFAWTDTTGTLSGSIKTPYIDLGEEIKVQYIDIYITDVDGSDVDIDSVEIDVIRGGTVTNVSGTLVDSNDHRLRYFINSLTELFRVVIDVTARGGTEEIAGIGRINVVYAPASSIESARLRV